MWRAQITGPVTAGYDALAPQGGSTADIGTISVAGAQGSLTPKQLTVNGDVCALTLVMNADTSG